MIDVGLGLIKSVFNGVVEAVKYALKRWFPPKIGFALIPSNILEVIHPYTNQGKVVELLGAPHHKDRNQVTYRFSNAFLQILYDETGAVDTVTVAALRTRWPNRTNIHPLSFKLNKNTMADVSEARPMVLKRDGSSKFNVYWRSEYFGFPGSYNYFSFGVIEAATWPGLTMPPSVEYSWDDSILQRPEKVRFNIVAVSRDEPEFFPFTWSSMH